MLIYKHREVIILEHKKIRAITLKRAIELDKHTLWTYVHVAEKITNKLKEELIEKGENPAKIMYEGHMIYYKLMGKFIPYYDI